MGLKMARASVVNFTDADDEIDPNMPRIGVDALNSAGADIAFGPTKRLSPNGTYYLDPIDTSSAQETLRAMFTDRIPQTGSIMWRKDFLQSIGGWAEDLCKWDDHELLTRALATNPNVTHWNGPGNSWMDVPRPGRMTSDVSERALRSMLTVLERQYTTLVSSQIKSADSLIMPMAYNVWQVSARHGSRSVERQCAAFYRSIGGCRHRGTKSHRIIASLLGLKAKEMISAWAKARF
jgi:hypothetical protein